MQAGCNMTMCAQNCHTTFSPPLARSFACAPTVPVSEVPGLLEREIPARLCTAQHFSRGGMGGSRASGARRQGREI